MTSGGTRNRNRLPDPNSGRSERRGYSLSALPAEGFTGAAPEFPLPDASGRELDVWADAWTSPQAFAWAQPSERWRIPTVAMWVRVKVRCEDPEAGAALYAQLHRFADQVGMTSAGLAEMGWAIATDEVAEKRAKNDGTGTPAKAKSSRDRMKVVKPDGA